MKRSGMFEINQLRGDADHMKHRSMNSVENPASQPISRGLKDGPVKLEV